MASQNSSPKWLDFFLVQDGDTIPYTLTEDELARILYKPDCFNFGEFDVIKIDQTAMRTVKLKVRQGVDIEKHKLTHQYEIREGLYVQQMKEVKVERVIKLSWVPSDVEDHQIIEVLQLFGKVTKPPVDAKFQIRDNAPALTKT